MIEWNKLSDAARPQASEKVLICLTSGEWHTAWYAEGDTFYDALGQSFKYDPVTHWARVTQPQEESAEAALVSEYKALMTKEAARRTVHSLLQTPARMTVVRIVREFNRALLYGAGDYYIIAQPDTLVEVGDFVEYERGGAGFGWFTRIAQPET